MPSDGSKNVKRVRELAGKMATAAMAASAYERFDAEELAQYCWDAAAAIYTFDSDDLDEVDEEDED